MKTYTIYHINGDKIGVTTNIKRRMREQGFSNWEILEEHTDIYIASDREIELQKQYGYRVDEQPYYISINKLNKNRSLGGRSSRPPVHQIGKRKLTTEDVIYIRNEYNRIKTSTPLANKYNVTRAAILKIVNRKTYRDI